jgi:hypothetical protein
MLSYVKEIVFIPSFKKTYSQLDILNRVNFLNLSLPLYFCIYFVSLYETLSYNRNSKLAIRKANTEM